MEGITSMHKQRRIQMILEYYYIVVRTKYYYNRIQYWRTLISALARYTNCVNIYFIAVELN